MLSGVALAKVPAQGRGAAPLPTPLAAWVPGYAR